METALRRFALSSVKLQRNPPLTNVDYVNYLDI